MKDSFWATTNSTAVLFEHTQKTILAKIEDEKPKPTPAPKPAERACKECGRITSNPCR